LIYNAELVDVDCWWSLTNDF